MAGTDGAHVQIFEGKAPRVLVAVVLDQDEATLYWEKLEEALRDQVTTLSWDLLIVDVTPRAGPNYAAWLADVVHRWPRSRVRRLSAEHVRDGLVVTFSDRRFAIKAGLEAATELFGRWRSYTALWLLRPDARPAQGALQAAWDNQTLFTHEASFQELLERPVNRAETDLERSTEGESFRAVAGTMRVPTEVEAMLQATEAEPEAAAGGSR
ncbi:MAG: hypothetical protein ACRDNK_21530 [Solirubrobacteraceae bacterium]